ncbi:calcium activated cation channel [Laetiporus sulphureus 93-53]|uniref:Calcium activated cation channel n=1 Tax=Laetiporus sulphureus 93-53 TaxID=1314785 RepID=A0A165DUM0_9APHY|nr:calcium activated cation channel [Laetiporus sulphureus 93-53]KZT05660.1 calcium activated cation channel [Laetiporus sulphureus 93-53]
MAEQNTGIEGQNHDELFRFVNAHRPSPDTVTSLIRRMRALTLKLLPVEVPPESLADPTSRVITPQVIEAYMAAAGDFLEVLPYCLLRARKEFVWDANNNPADFGENSGRAVACEVLARRVIHQAPSDQTVPMMSTRFRYKETDDGISEKASALELAIDSHCTIFLSSTEAQDVVNYLWNGQLVQKHGHDHDIDFVPYRKYGCDGFWAHLDPGRLSVPRYQNIFRIVVWLFFLFAYSQAVREPLDKLDPDHSELDIWEVIMYILALSFSFENMHRIYKLFLFASWRSLGFWDIVSFMTDSLLLVAFILRVAGIASEEPSSVTLRILSFQCLSFVAPLIWMKVIQIFDGFKFVGTMQICVARMLKESGIFFGLLALLGIGFMQGLYALDAADGQADHSREVVHVLVQALLQSPNYEMFAGSPAGQSLYYLWNVVTAVILLNVLISLFSSAYNDVVEDAAAEYMTYFAGKVSSMIRAPDDYVYPAPFNIFEIFLVAPFEFFVSETTYAKINRYVMLVIFFVPLSIVALYEAELEPSKNRWIKDWLAHPDEGGEGTPEFENPEVHADDAAKGLKISKVPFVELVKLFPDATHSTEAVLLKEIRQVKEQIEELKQLMIKKPE